jgi:hypothetical protein
MKHLSSTSAAAGADPDIRRRGTPQRWLVVHQVLVSIVYIAMLFPAWRARDWLGAPWNMVFLLSVLAAAAAGTSLRLHLCFIANTFPGELPAQRAWTWRWTRLCDVTFAAAQLAAAVAIGGAHAAFAMLFVGVSAALLVASFVIEPATARAALPPPTASTSSSRA